MIGAIAGDIIGSVYEFNNIKTEKFPLFSANCTFTDVRWTPSLRQNKVLAK